MIYSIYAHRDTTIYESNKTQNTGIDEILEITKTVSSSLQPGVTNTRFLIDFSTTELSKSVVDGVIPSGSEGPVRAEYRLRVFNSTQEQVPHTYTLTANPVSQSWSTGVSKVLDTPVTQEGCSWRYRDGLTPNTAWQTEGATVYAGFECSQSFTNASGDIYMDITIIVTNSFNDPVDTLAGIMVQRPVLAEQDGVRYGSLKYFSTETHTIYPPRLDVMWDYTVYNVTGLAAISSTEDINITIPNLQEEYSTQAKTSLRVIPKLRYPQRTYATSSVGYSNNHLPSTTYYSIIDGETGEVLIDYNTNYTKVSCDSNGNFFKLWMTSFLPERYYAINIRVDDRLYAGSREFYSPAQMFKVVR